MTDTPSDLDRWVVRLAEALQIDPAEVPTGALLELTREVAHGVTRPAGPVTTFLLGIALARGARFADAASSARSLIPEAAAE